MTGRRHVDCLWVLCNNTCNLDCPNCYTPKARRPEEVRRLSWGDLKGAIDHFMGPQISCPYRRTITVFGGEPLMDLPLVERAAAYLPRFDKPPVLEVYTNGTLLRPAHLKRLRYDHLQLYVSLDGAREGNDRYRRFWRRAGESVHDKVTAVLDALPLEQVAIHAVVYPGNMDGMLEAIDGWARRGIRTIDLVADFANPWPAPALKRLERFSREFARYYAERLINEGRVPFGCCAIDHAVRSGSALLRGEAWWRHCDQLVLGADGNYYDCEGILYMPYPRVGGRHGIGRARGGRGPDWQARQRYLDEAVQELGRLGVEDEWFVVCPIMYCKAARLMGSDLSAIVRTAAEISEAFLAPLGRLALDCARHPAFKRRYLDEKLDAWKAR